MSVNVDKRYGQVHVLFSFEQRRSHQKFREDATNGPDVDCGGLEYMPAWFREPLLAVSYFLET